MPSVLSACSLDPGLAQSGVAGGAGSNPVSALEAKLIPQRQSALR